MTSGLYSILNQAREADKIGDHSMALMKYRLFLKHETKDPSAWADYAGLLLIQGRYEECLQACARALEIDTGFESALINKVGALIGLNCFDEAKEICENLLKLDFNRIYRQPSAGAWTEVMDAVVDDCEKNLESTPENISLLTDKANILVQRGCIAESISVFKKILSVEPHNININLTIGSCLLIEGNLEAAQSHFENVLELDPDNTSALEYLIIVLIRKNDFNNSISIYDKLINISYTGDEKKWESAGNRLLHGDFKEGFEMAEARLKIPNLIMPVRNFSQPQWDGKPFTGLTLLLHFEQGYGDTIMMSRYGQTVKALGGKLVVQVQTPIVDLIKTCPGFDDVIDYKKPLPYFDIQLSLMSLPFVLGTESNTIPNSVSYLSVPENISNKHEIDSRIVLTKPSLRVAIVWSGNPNYERNENRSISVQLLKQLSEIEDITWYSFQREDINILPIAGMVPMGDLFDDFSDTAYALSKMDFVVSVDTAIAHLAGAMGIPVFLVIPFMPDWRWMLGRSDSPWYPTMKIYRHPAPGNCSEAIRNLMSDLTEKCNSLPKQL